jgi:hypothetical protein
VLTGGRVQSGTWDCPAYGDVTRFRLSDGRYIRLTPGNTWVELVPNQYYPVSIQR